MSNVPKIRFKGFEGEWKETPFASVAHRVSTSETSGILPGVEFEDIISGAGLLNKNLCDKNCKKIGKLFSCGDILFGKLRPYLRNILLADFDGVAIGDFWVLRPEGIEPKLLYELVNSAAFMNVANVSSGSKMPRADWVFVSNASFDIPYDEEEQKKISSYFITIDKQISAQAKKIASLRQMKEASLQAMFPAEGETVPRVRFKGFDGEWKKVKLSSYAKRITRKNSNLETSLPVTIASADGIISQTSFFNNVVASANLRGYYLIKRGEFAYNKSYSNGYPYGSVKRMERYDMGALSTLYIVFELNDEINHSFMISFFETALWHKEVAMRAAEGARNHGLLNISANDFLDITVLVPPSLSEQQKIASYFTSLDKQISVQTKRLEKLRQIKSACLDAMFV